MTIVQLKDLERRLAEAKGPDAEIDALIWAELDGRDVRDDVERKMLFAKSRKPPHDECVLGWYDPGKTSRNFSPLNDHHHGRFTASLDAAIALVERVLKHHEINLNLYRDRDNEWNWCATLTSLDEPDEGEDPDRWWALAPHPHSALALCLACVRALIAQLPNQPEKERT